MAVAVRKVFINLDISVLSKRYVLRSRESSLSFGKMGAQAIRCASSFASVLNSPKLGNLKNW